MISLASKSVLLSGLSLCFNRTASMATKSTVTNCLFCDIIKENDKNKIIFEDQTVVVFPDIKPAAKYHFLVVPKHHIEDAKKLSLENKGLLEHMVSVGESVLQAKGESLNDTRLGFHWPPFNSIRHLHLHAISPTNSMSFISRTIFKPGTWWFVTPDYVFSRL